MSETDYEKLEKSLERLKEQYANYLRLDEQCLPPIIGEAIKESAIKRFDICYDTLLTHLKKFMEEELGLPKIPNSPKGIFRVAHESGIIDREMAEALFKYNQLRIDTSHDYSLEKSGNVLTQLGNFIQDATELYEQMAEQE